MNNSQYQNVNFRMNKNVKRQFDDIASEARQVLKEIREEAVQNGTNNLTMDEINAEIALYRKEKRDS